MKNHSCNLHIPICGIFCLHSVDVARYAKFREAKKQFVERYEGGESMLQLAQRVYNLLDEVKASGKTCILVAHNGIARVVQSYFYEMTNEEYAAFGVDNCAILQYEFSGEENGGAKA